MMRCPKCESLAVADGMSLDYKIKYFTCVNKECGYHFDDIKYQARVKKVLSRFESVWDSQYPYKQLILNTKNNSSKLVNDVWKKEKSISYLYKEDSSEQFFLMVDFYLDNELQNTYEVERSLETVESLIKDLEETK